MTALLRSETLRSVALFDADPDLARGLGGLERRLANGHACASLIELEPNGWGPGPQLGPTTDGWLGLLLLDGLMIRRVSIGSRSACELCGPEDLLRPWESDGDYPPLSVSVDWRVLQTSRLAVLDDAFAMRIRRWPTITNRLIERSAQRARHLSLTQAVVHTPHVHDRLLMLFWVLAERWGKVGVEGIYLRLPVTHEILAMIAGARRPTVTIALRRLASTGLLVRESRHSWLLTNRSVEALGDPGQFSGLELERRRIPASARGRTPAGGFRGAGAG